MIELAIRLFFIIIKAKTMQHTETRYSQYSPRQLFDLVMNIESYPNFLPWCAAARILSRDKNITFAELVVSFKAFSDRYTSKIEHSNGDSLCEISVEQTEGPFKYLKNMWKFELDPLTSQTKIDFTIDFCFKSSLMQKMVGLVFERALIAMMSAFEARAKEVYAV